MDYVTSTSAPLGPNEKLTQWMPMKLRVKCGLIIQPVVVFEIKGALLANRISQARNF